MPAEWEPHAATWLSWPHNPETWPGRLPRIPPIWAEMVRTLVTGETVHILIHEAAPAEEAWQVLRAAGVPLARVVRHTVATNDAWMRDHGPIFVVRGQGETAEVAVTDWVYNAWGGKYPPWDADDAVPQRVAELLGLPRFATGMVLEGGSIDVNGCGTALTTEACLLHPNRNPAMTRTEIEQMLCDMLGIRHVLWLGDGIAGDDTDGHVDDLARFVASDCVVTVVEEDPADENYAPLQDNLRRLQAMVDQDGRPLRVVPLPMPRPIDHEGQRLPASYANFYIGNAAVLVPTFDDPADAAALETLARLFPDRCVQGILAIDLVGGFGAFHCVTQQQPAGGGPEGPRSGSEGSRGRGPEGQSR